MDGGVGFSDKRRVASPLGEIVTARETKGRRVEDKTVRPRIAAGKAEPPGEDAARREASRVGPQESTEPEPTGTCRLW